FEEIEGGGPAAVPALVNGVVGTYQEAVDDIIRYAALLTDEMISSGTFETRRQVDIRRIQPDNATLTSELYTPLHLARMQADTTALLLGERVGDPVFADVEDDLRVGVALS
ncbi:MAG TPA: hypothetical protein VFQ22_08915, partial [Longimicrobiales bacterium]|nr:hypothetical protein [Longimicrobiales bacterium]